MRNLKNFLLSGIASFWIGSNSPAYSQVQKSLEASEKQYEEAMKNLNLENYEKDENGNYRLKQDAMNQYRRQPKNDYNFSGSENRNSSEFGDAIKTGAAIVGAYIILNKAIKAMSSSKNKNYNQENSYQENSYQNVEAKGLGDFWGSEPNNNSENNMYMEGSEITEDISSLEKELMTGKFDGKKIYLKYIAPAIEDKAKELADNNIPGGSMIYEIIKVGPNNFMVKKVKDSEEICGKFENKSDKITGGVIMMVDELTGNYRKKVYEIAKASQEFWGNVKEDKIKRKYGENSVEYLNYKIFGIDPELGSTSY